jgi:hypothetical protein
MATRTASSGHLIRINRAPVLTLWGACVAERLGFDPDAALTLGKAVAVVNAQSKGRRLGIFSPPPPETAPAQHRRRPAERWVELFGRSIPVVQTEAGPRAMLGGETIRPSEVQRSLERSFGDALPAVRRAMRELAESFPKPRLAGAAWRLYERFRPEIPPGQRGWGARGELDLHVLRALRPPRPATAARARRATRPPGAAAADAAETHWTTKESSTMGQAANSGRNATLDQKKARAAGRGGRTGQAPRAQIKDRMDEPFAKGKAAGAFGKGGVANPRGRGSNTRGAGGGGGSGSRPKDAAVAGQVKTGRSTRPARKGGT